MQARLLRTTAILSIVRLFSCPPSILQEDIFEVVKSDAERTSIRFARVSPSWDGYLAVVSETLKEFGCVGWRRGVRFSKAFWTM